MKKEVVIIGAGGHAKVIADIIYKSGDIVLGFLDDNKELGSNIIKEPKLSVIGTINDIHKIQQKNNSINFIIGIGDNKTRRTIAEKYNDINYYTAIHPTAQIGIDIEIEKGTTIMANTCINTSSKIGKHCIINTGSIIEHDNKIGDYVHISPNATLCGTVEIGENTHVGAGTTIKNNIKICDNTIIGCGTIIIRDIWEKGTYVGIPSQKIK